MNRKEWEAARALPRAVSALQDAYEKARRVKSPNYRVRRGRDTGSWEGAAKILLREGLAPGVYVSVAFGMFRPHPGIPHLCSSRLVEACRHDAPRRAYAAQRFLDAQESLLQTYLRREVCPVGPERILDEVTYFSPLFRWARATMLGANDIAAKYHDAAVEYAALHPHQVQAIIERYGSMPEGL